MTAAIILSEMRNLRNNGVLNNALSEGGCGAVMRKPHTLTLADFMHALKGGASPMALIK